MVHQQNTSQSCNANQDIQSLAIAKQDIWQVSKLDTILVNHLPSHGSLTDAAPQNLEGKMREA